MYVLVVLTEFYEVGDSIFVDKLCYASTRK